MDVNELIITTLSPLNYPIDMDKYNPSVGEVPSPIYITFNYEDDRGEVFADNKPKVDIAYIQIHLFAPESFNYMLLKKQIRSKLFKAGFTYAKVTQRHETDTKINHIIFQCEISGKSETEE